MESLSDTAAVECYSNHTIDTGLSPTYLREIAQATLLGLPPAWAVALVLLLVLNLKNVPLAWHLRIVNALSYVLRSQRTSSPDSTACVFDAVITESLSPITEIDFNLHKSNSTYFSDLDIARANLICTLFNRGIEATRFASSHHVVGGGNTQLIAMLGGVSCAFKWEIKPYERYLMWSRILCWDEKWFWVVTWFVEPHMQRTQDGMTRERKVFATAVSKCVFKKGRKTVRPDTMMRLSGLLRESAMEFRDAEAKDIIEGSGSVADSECQRRRGLELIDSQEGLEQLHGLFKSNCRTLARRHGLDFSPFLLPKLVYLFGEWVGDRFSRLFRRSGEVTNQTR